MKQVRAWLLRLAGHFRKGKKDAEFAEELESHLEMHAEENVRNGMGPEAARRVAVMKLGGVEQTKESYREQRSLPALEVFFQDLRFGLRMLLKNPGFTAVAVLTLGLGIGANTAIFSLVNGILLASLPYPAPERLVSITGTYPKGAVVALRGQARTMDVAAYYEGHEYNLTGMGEPVRLMGTVVSAEFFSVLGAQPERGRTFHAGEDIAGQDSYVILSHELWLQRFAGDSGIVGRVIELSGVGREVVGIMQADFRFPSPRTQVWIPIHNDSSNAVLYWADDFMPVLGRLRAGFTRNQGDTEIRMFQSRVGELFPWRMPKEWNADVSVIPLQSGMVADMRVRLVMLLGAVTLIVLIACANVANLTLARAATREKEIAVRAALGAKRGRLARQLLTESVLLASMGGLLGLLLAGRGFSLLKVMLPADTPRIAETQMDWRVFAFAGGLAILTGVLSGLGPALHSSRTSASLALRSGGRGGTLPLSQRLRSSLVVTEVAFAVLVVIAAGLLIRSFWALSHVDPGFRTAQLLTARITPNQSFCSDTERCVSFYRSLVEEVRNSPGVNGAAVVNTLPLGGRVAKRSLDVEGYNVAEGKVSPLFWMHAVSADYFQTIGAQVIAGRPFVEADVASAPVAVITAETARRFWPNQDPVGKHVRFLGDKEWRTVVGIVGDLRDYDLQRNIPTFMTGAIYVPYNAHATLEDGRMPAEMSMVIRTTGSEAEAAAALRRGAGRLNAEVPVSEVKSMSNVVSETVTAPRSIATLFLVFAGLALTLGIIGIYGVLSFLVSNRTQEIGIRMALGARRRDVLWSVLKEGGKFAGAGIVLGIVGAMALMRVISSQLYGVSPADPVTFGGAALLFSGVALLACFIPARRATRVDPMIALRYE